MCPSPMVISIRGTSLEGIICPAFWSPLEHRLYAVCLRTDGIDLNDFGSIRKLVYRVWPEPALVRHGVSWRKDYAIGSLDREKSMPQMEATGPRRSSAHSFSVVSLTDFMVFSTAIKSPLSVPMMQRA